METKTAANLKEKSKNIHQNHRKRMKAKFLENGFANFAEHEILEFLLFFSIPYSDTNPIAHKLIKRFGSFASVLDANHEQLLEIEGVGEHTATFLKSVPEIFNFYSKSRAKALPRISGATEAISYSRLLFQGMTTEAVYVICLDSQGGIISTKQVAKGNFNKVPIAVRDVTKFVLKNNSDRILIAHNHPFNKATPSDEDIVFTHKLFNSCLLNDIDILDHIVIGKTDNFSFAREGIMQDIKTKVFNQYGTDNSNVVFRRNCMAEFKDTYLFSPALPDSK